MTEKGRGGFDIRHNIAAKMISRVMNEEITRALNLSAEALVGGVDSDKKTFGISTVFKHDSKGSGKPSPRGTPPGVLSGRLRTSFRTRPARKVGGILRVSGGTDVFYAKLHEFGIGGMPARPFMRRGIKSATPYIAKTFRALGPKIRSRIRQEAGPIR